MQIRYLKELEKQPVRSSDADVSISNQPISLQEISQLENVYNNGAPFPQSLKELLYLAGEDCYVLDYGQTESQQELQESVRQRLLSKGRLISRNFYVIDIYNWGDQFLFIYLDEGDDPPVYEGHYYDSPNRSNWITLVTSRLSTLINNSIVRVREGRNPF